MGPGSKGEDLLGFVIRCCPPAFVEAAPALILVCHFYVSSSQKQNRGRAVLSQPLSERAKACWEWSLRNENIQSVSATLSRREMSCVFQPSWSNLFTNIINMFNRLVQVRLEWVKRNPFAMHLMGSSPKHDFLMRTVQYNMLRTYGST